MRRVLFGLCLLAVSGCSQGGPEHSFPVFFTPFSAQLDTPALAIIQNAAAIAKRYPAAPVEVVGYADSTVGPIENSKLSQQRADAVTAQLIQDGVPGSNIVTKAGDVPPSSQPGVKDRRAEIDLDLP